jgi:hypothetical protein
VDHRGDDSCVGGRGDLRGGGNWRGCGPGRNAAVTAGRSCVSSRYDSTAPSSRRPRRAEFRLVHGRTGSSSSERYATMKLDALLGRCHPGGTLGAAPRAFTLDLDSGRESAIPTPAAAASAAQLSTAASADGKQVAFGLVQRVDARPPGLSVERRHDTATGRRRPAEQCRPSSGQDASYQTSTTRLQQAPFPRAARRIYSSGVKNERVAFSRSAK